MSRSVVRRLPGRQHPLQAPLVMGGALLTMLVAGYGASTQGLLVLVAFVALGALLGVMVRPEIAAMLFIAALLANGRTISHIGSAPVFMVEVFLFLLSGALLLRFLVKGETTPGQKASIILFLTLFVPGIAGFFLETNWHVLPVWGRNFAIVYYTLFALIFASLRPSKELYKRLFAFVMIGGVVALLLVFSGNGGGFAPVATSTGATRIAHGSFAIVFGIAPLALIAVYRQKLISRWYLLLLPPLLFGLVLINHRSSWIAFVVALSVLFATRLTPGVLAVFGTIFLLVVFLASGTVGDSVPFAKELQRAQTVTDTTDPNAKWRLNFWRNVVHSAFEHPLYGAGFDNYPAEFVPPESLKDDVPAPHNSFIALAYRIGPLPWLLVVFQLLRMLSKAFRQGVAERDRHRRAAVTALVATLTYQTVFSTFNVSFELPYSAPIYWAQFGLLATLLLTPVLPERSSKLLQRNPGQLDPEPSMMRERRVLKPAFAGGGFDGGGSGGRGERRRFGSGGDGGVGMGAGGGDFASGLVPGAIQSIAEIGRRTAAQTHRSFKSTILKTFVGQIGFALLGFVGALLSARLLGPEGRGQLTVLILIPSMLTVFLEFGQEFTMSHLAAESRRGRRAMHGNAIAYTLLLVPVGLALSALGISLFTSVSGAILPLAIAGGVATALGTYLRFLSGLAMGTNQVTFYSMTRLTLAGSYPALLIALTLLHHQTSTSFFYAWCASNVFVAALFLSRFSDTLSWPSKAVGAKQVRVGMPIHISNVAQFLLLRSDQLVLSVVAGAAAVGMYSVGVNLVEALWMLPAAAGLASIPFLSGDAPEEQKQKAMMTATGISIWLTVVGAVFLGAIAPFLVPLVFGKGYEGAVLPLELLLPGIVAAALVRITTAALIAKKHTKPLVRYMLLALALNLGLNLALIPPFEASGAAMASTIAYAVLGAALLREATRIWDVPARGCLAPPVGAIMSRLGRGKTAAAVPAEHGAEPARPDGRGETTTESDTEGRVQ